MMSRFGYISSPDDYRDYSYRAIKGKRDLPNQHYLQKIKIKNQSSLGSCVGFAGSYVKDHQEKINHPQMNYETSPMYLYSECKRQDGIPHTEGTYPRIAMQVLLKQGIALEKDMPYKWSDKFNLPTPNQQTHKQAEHFKIGAYARVYAIDEIKQAIADNQPVMIGLILCENFEHPENGFIDLPQGHIIGGHAMCIDGYDDNMTFTYKNGVTRKGFFRVVNSWGEEWGDKGYCYIPYDYHSFRTDIGMNFFDEAWTSVDVLMPNEKVGKIELWLGSKKAIVDGVEVELEQEPILDETTERTLLPVRFLVEAFGFKVDWNANEKKITITKE